MDLQEQVARIDRTLAETQKLQQETQKFVAEFRKLTVEATLAPWSIAIGFLAAGGALVGATVALMRLLG